MDIITLQTIIGVFSTPEEAERYARLRAYALGVGDGTIPPPEGE